MDDHLFVDKGCLQASNQSMNAQQVINLVQHHLYVSILIVCFSHSL